MTSLTAYVTSTGDNQVNTEDVKTERERQVLKEKEVTSSKSLYENPDGVFKTMGVSSYKQKTSFWCGPVTVRQVLDFFRIPSSQTT